MTGVELFTIGTTAVTVGDAFSAVSALSTVSGMIQGGQQAKVQGQWNEYNAAVANNQAIAARQAAAYEEGLQRDRVKSLIARQKAAVAGSGGTLEGSSLLLIEDAAQQGELDALAIRYSGSVNEARAKSKAAADRIAGANSRMGAGGAYLSGGASLLTGLSSIGRTKATSPT